MDLVSTASKDRLARLHGEAATELENLERALDDVPIPVDLLRLTDRFVDVSLRGEQWQPPESMTPIEKACLDYCGQFMASVASIEDAQVAALREHLSPDQVYLYANAVYLIEMSKRLDLTLEAVLP
ncbi:MAG: hypothetical protein AAFQ99_06765 [Pseudomonadota bacterium]